MKLFSNLYKYNKGKHVNAVSCCNERYPDKGAYYGNCKKNARKVQRQGDKEYGNGQYGSQYTVNYKRLPPAYLNGKNRLDLFFHYPVFHRFNYSSLF